MTCRHVFCASCIIEWFSKSNVCPLDRSLFYSINIYENKWSTYPKTKVLKCASCHLSGRKEHTVCCNDCQCRIHIDCGGSIQKKHIRIPFIGNYFCLDCIKERSSPTMVSSPEVPIGLPSTSCREDNSSEKCAICSSLIENQKVGKLDSCKHGFCASCIIEWSNKNNTCPLDKKSFAVIIIYENRNGFLEHWYCRCQSCQNNEFLPCNYCKSTVEHMRVSWYNRISRQLYLCINCGIRGHRAALLAALAPVLLRMKQLKKSLMNTQGEKSHTKSPKSDKLADINLSSSSNEIKSENKKEERNQTNKNQLHCQVLEREEKKNQTKNYEGKVRSISPIRWVSSSSIRDLSSNTITSIKDSSSSSKSRFQRFSKKRPQIRRQYQMKSSNKPIRRTVLRTHSGVLKIIVNFRDVRSRLPVL